MRHLSTAFFLSSDTVVGADELNNRSCDNGCKVLLRQSKGCEKAALYFKKHENLKQTKTNLSRGKKMFRMASVQNKHVLDLI